MMKRRNLIWLIPLGLMATFPAWRIPVGKFLTPRTGYDYQSAKTAGDSQNFNMETVKILQSKNGRVTAEIRAQKAFTTKTPDEYILDTVNADIFNNDGESTTIVAARGIFNSSTKKLTLMDDVIITKNPDNQRLYTDLLHYDDNKRLVNCPGKTHIKGNDIDVTGTGLDYDVAAGLYELGGRVLCIIQGSATP